MTLILETGNLFNSDADAFAHGVNTKGLMGAGIAVEFKHRYPKMYTLYKTFCKEGLLQPGDVWTYQSLEYLGTKTIFNIASQDEPGPNARLEWFESGLRDMITEAEKLGIETIAMPRIGCGIGGLKWEDVLDIIEHYAAKTNVNFEVWSLND